MTRLTIAEQNARINTWAERVGLDAIVVGYRQRWIGYHFFTRTYEINHRRGMAS